MYIMLVVGVIIVLAVLLVSVLTTSKAYQFKHTVDSLDDNPHLKDQEKKEDGESPEK